MTLIVPKRFGSDDVTITSDNAKKRFLAYFEVVAATDPKTGTLLVIRSNPNF